MKAARAMALVWALSLWSCGDEGSPEVSTASAVGQPEAPLPAGGGNGPRPIPLPIPLRPDGGSATDAGAIQDGGGGSGSDGGLLVDGGGGGSDAGTLPDAGEPDAGTEFDAGTTFDAGIQLDAGTGPVVLPDSGTMLDAGLLPSIGLPLPPFPNPRNPGLPLSLTQSGGCDDPALRDRWLAACVASGQLGAAAQCGCVANRLFQRATCAEIAELEVAPGLGDPACL